MTDKQAIDVIKSECYVFNPLNMDRTTLINTALDRAVDALKGKQWILTSECLPDNDDYVLVWHKRGEMYLMCHDKDGWWESVDGEGFSFEDSAIIAWMPLPKPYEDEETEEERNRRLCRENYAAQMESLGYDVDGNKK